MIERYHPALQMYGEQWMASRLKVMKHLMTSPSHVSTMIGGTVIFLTEVLCFALDGTIPTCYYNVP